MVETEILFGGRKNIQTPKEDLDAIMAARINELEWVEELGVSRSESFKRFHLMIIG